ncbi:MAG: hypothetical protein C5B49_15870 [Bdellovibrio sp.]|nr:MAG: hypothetical protein C5B49_15870 [Bdellovibrio sp.]
MELRMKRPKLEGRKTRLSLALSFMVLGTGCGGFNLTPGSSLDDAMMRVQNFYQAPSGLSWSMRLQPPELNEFSQVTRWMDATGKGIALYPPNNVGAASLNFSESATFDTVLPNQVTLGKNSSLSTAVADLSITTGDSYTFAFLIKSVELPSADNSTVRILDFAPANGDQVGYLAIDLVKTAAGFNIQPIIWYDSKNYQSISITPAADQIKGPLGLVVRFSQIPNQMQVAVNGALATTASQNVGNPPNIGLSTRRLILHNLEGASGSDGNFALSEVGLQTQELADADLAALSLALAQLYGGTGALSATPTPTPDPSASPITFSDLIGTDSSKNVFAANCMGCHSSSTASGGLDLSNFAQASAQASAILTAVQPNAPDPMPKGLSSLSASSVDIIRRWIADGLQK